MNETCIPSDQRSGPVGIHFAIDRIGKWLIDHGIDHYSRSQNSQNSQITEWLKEEREGQVGRKRVCKASIGRVSPRSVLTYKISGRDDWSLRTSSICFDEVTDDNLNFGDVSVLSWKVHSL